MESPPIGRKASIVDKLNFRTKSVDVVDNAPITFVPDDYTMGPVIGYGSSAIVYLATYKPTNKNVAIKLIDLDMFERNQIDELRREIQIMSLSKHQNLLQVYGSFVHTHKLYIVTPFLAAGSCLDIMKTAFPHGFEEQAIATILRQALLGLEYLHKNGLIHRDVKAGNLLVAEDGLVQLADFGVSNSLMEVGERNGVRKTFVGTPCWMAPEVMEQSGYDYKADIWSFGITAIELATGHAPFAKYPPMKVLMMTLQNDPPTLDREQTKHKYSKTFKEMIDTCLQKDPLKRPTAEKLLQHPFFKQAKKGTYLVQTILTGLPAIHKRSHNRRNIKFAHDGEREVRQGESWDFEGLGKDEKRQVEDLKNADRSMGGLDDSFSSLTKDESGQRRSRFTLEESASKAGEQSGPNSRQVSFAAQGSTVSPVLTPTLGPSSAAQEVKKGRFTVNEQNLNNSQTSLSTFSPVDTNPRDPEFGRQDSQVSISQQGSSVASPSSIIPPEITPAPSLSSRPSRFTVTSDSALPSAQSLTAPNSGTIPRRGRFELSENGTHLFPHNAEAPALVTSPNASLSRPSVASGLSLEEQVIALSRQVEMQKLVLSAALGLLADQGANQEEVKRLFDLLKK